MRFSTLPPLSRFLSLPYLTLFLFLRILPRRRSRTLERALETLQWRTIIPSTRRRGVKAGRSDRQGGAGSGRRPLHLVMNFKLARIHNAAPLTVGMNRRWQSKTAGLIFPGACAANYLPTTTTTTRITTTMTMTKTATIVDKVEYRMRIEARDKGRRAKLFRYIMLSASYDRRNNIGSPARPLRRPIIDQ